MQVLIALCLAALQENCGECHSAAHDGWKDSVHAEKRIGCVDCHGTDEIDRTKKGDPHVRIPGFRAGRKHESPQLCASCHEGVFKAFEESAHHELTQDEEFDGCLSCHDAHGTKAADRKAILESRCHGCHKEGSEYRGLGEEYVAQAGSLSAAVGRLKDRLDHPKPGVPQAAEKEMLPTFSGALQSARIAQHSCAFKTLKDQLGPAVHEAQQSLKALEERDRGTGNRVVWLLAFLGVFALNAMLVRAWLKRPSKPNPL